MSFNGTLMTRVGSQSSPTIEPRNCVRYFGNLCGKSVPRWVHQFHTISTAPNRSTSLSVNWRHRGAMPLDIYAREDIGIPAQDVSARRDQYPGVGSYNWIDVALSFDIR